MPLPEGLSELTFAGALGGRRMRMIRRQDSLPLAAEADFCITGTVDPDIDTRADVYSTVKQVLDDLPRTYTPELYEDKCDTIYHHIFDA